MNNLWDAEMRADLHRLIKEKFNLDELKTLAFYLGIEHEAFAQNTLAEFTRELILYCERRDRLNCLIEEILRQRPELNQSLTPLLAQFPPCRPSTKVQVIIDRAIDHTPALIAALAAALGISAGEITLIAAVRSSVRLLLDIPITAVDFTRFAEIFALLNGKYYVLSIEEFIFLDENDQRTWQLAAIQHPPQLFGEALYPVISWQTAQVLAGTLPATPEISAAAADSSHWLAQSTNQIQLFNISRQIVSKLAPGEVEQLGSLFPQYVQLAQRGRVQTVQQAAQAFDLGEGTVSIAFTVLSMLVTAFSTWLTLRKKQTLTELNKQAEWQTLSELMINALKEGRIPFEVRERIKLAMDEVVPSALGDAYTPYERGLAQLETEMEPSLELLSYTQQLLENIRRARQYGDNETLRSRRSEIIEQLNRLAYSALGLSFNAMCKSN
jgi:hypothetical protein